MMKLLLPLGVFWVSAILWASEVENKTEPTVKPAQQLKTPVIKIKVTGLKNHEGQIMFMIFDEKNSEFFIKDTKKALATQVIKPIVDDLGPDQKPIEGQTTFSVPDLPPGKYAFALFHDEDSNGKLGFRWIPPGPSEGTAASNNATGSFGPPSFKDAVFDLKNQDLEMTVKVSY